MPDLGLTHVALTAHDLDASIAFYEKYARMAVVHRRAREGVRSVWLGFSPVLPDRCGWTAWRGVRAAVARMRSAHRSWVDFRSSRGWRYARAALYRQSGEFQPD